ncbi:MAG TPA: proton-conducting transporter membrane subunit [Thermoanaerobaculia bacterium]
MVPQDDLAAAALPLLVAAGCLLAASGVPGLLLRRRSSWGPRIATALTLAGSLVGLAGASLALGSAGGGTLEFASPVPGLRAGLAADALSAFFALPIFLVGGLGSLYGAAYWSPAHHPGRGRRLRLCYGLLLASLTFILLARDGVVFLVAWEAMALTTFFLVTTDEEEAAVRRAGWVYLLYSHASVLCLFALFALERQLTGDFAFRAIPADAPPGLRAAVFVLALVAFGIKAGAMPLHSWLPAAHAAAPSHVSALMSGVVIKAGIYGLVRTCGLLGSPPLGWGMTVLAVGSLAAFFGVLFALAQHDLKRLLAYHSIENVGIILLGLGLAMVGRSLGRPEWVALGLAGCLLHVWNHALFKSLLFFGAGSVAKATGTRDLELTGALARRMPATAFFFLVGAIAICGLPPLNGFVSELFVYLGLARAGLAPGTAWAAAPAPVLAATGALAVACFVKVYGIVFLGRPRGAAAETARESPPLMLAPMAVLALACVVLGAAPVLAVPALERASAAWARPPLAVPALASLVPLGWISAAALTLLAAVAALAAAVLPVCRRARRRAAALPTWDCGYAASSPRLQYSASSFAELVTSRFGWVLRPKVEAPRLQISPLDPPEGTLPGLFPAPAHFHSHVDDPVVDDLLAPAARRALRVTAAMRAVPRGQMQRYLLYVVAALVALLAWAVVAP